LSAKFSDSGEHAVETLYLVVQYFAWERCIHRYGPYALDPKTVEVLQKIRKEFSTDSIEVGPFCFFRTEQRALGQMMLTRAEGPSGTEFDVVPYFEFKKRLLADTTVSENPSVQMMLEVFRRASKASDLPPGTRKRMAKVHNLLADVVEHIENKVGICYSDVDGGRNRIREPETQLETPLAEKQAWT